MRASSSRSLSVSAESRDRWKRSAKAKNSDRRCLYATIPSLMRSTSARFWLTRRALAMLFTSSATSGGRLTLRRTADSALTVERIFTRINRGCCVDCFCQPVANLPRRASAAGASRLKAGCSQDWLPHLAPGPLMVQEFSGSVRRPGRPINNRPQVGNLPHIIARRRLGTGRIVAARDGRRSPMTSCAGVTSRWPIAGRSRRTPPS